MSFSTGSMHPTDNHFSALSFPVLSDRIFLYPAFTHRNTSIYSPPLRYREQTEIILSDDP